jgi:hypothetical protein
MEFFPLRSARMRALELKNESFVKVERLVRSEGDDALIASKLRPLLRLPQWGSVIFLFRVFKIRQRVQLNQPTRTEQNGGQTMRFHDDC